MHLFRIATQVASHRAVGIRAQAAQKFTFRAVVLDLRQRTVRTTSTLSVLASLVELSASPLTPCLAPEQVGTAIEQKGAAE